MTAPIEKVILTAKFQKRNAGGTLTDITFVTPSSTQTVITGQGANEPLARADIAAQLNTIALAANTAADDVNNALAALNPPPPAP